MLRVLAYVLIFPVLITSLDSVEFRSLGVTPAHEALEYMETALLASLYRFCFRALVKM